VKAIARFAGEAPEAGSGNPHTMGPLLAEPGGRHGGSS